MMYSLYFRNFFHKIGEPVALERHKDIDI